MRTNINGGAVCIMRAVPGYLKAKVEVRAISSLASDDAMRELPSGVWSFATTWEWPGLVHATKGALPPDHKTFRTYKPQGMIQQVPACRRDYKGKNITGGRKCPPSYIGAAHKHIPDSEQVSVRFRINNERVGMRPNVD